MKPHAYRCGTVSPVNSSAEAAWPCTASVSPSCPRRPSPSTGCRMLAQPWPVASLAPSPAGTSLEHGPGRQGLSPLQGSLTAGRQAGAKQSDGTVEPFPSTVGTKPHPAAETSTLAPMMVLFQAHRGGYEVCPTPRTKLVTATAVSLAYFTQQ